MNHSLQNVICQGFLERITCMQSSPQSILDVTGFLQPTYAELKNRYTNIEILTGNNFTDISKFANRKFDLVFYATEEVAELDMQLAAIQTILTLSGACLIQTFGPGSLNGEAEIKECIDLHNLGDLLLNLGYVDPVIDVDFYDRYELNYAYALAPKVTVPAQMIATKVCLE